MIKNNYKKVFIFIIGIALGTSVTVGAYSYYAKDISFTPANESWKVDNVEDALNDLHNTSSNEVSDLEKQISTKDTTITTLNTKVSSLNDTKSSLNSEYSTLTSKKTGLQNQLSNLTVAGRNLSFTSTLEIQTFDLGFTPGYISCITKYNSAAGGGGIMAIYNKDYNEDYVIRAINQSNDSDDTVNNVVTETYYTINSDGFSWNINSNAVNGSMVYCTVAK